MPIIDTFGIEALLPVFTHQYGAKDKAIRALLDRLEVVEAENEELTKENTAFQDPPAEVEWKDEVIDVIEELIGEALRTDVVGWVSPREVKLALEIWHDEEVEQAQFEDN